MIPRFAGPPERPKRLLLAKPPEQREVFGPPIAPSEGGAAVPGAALDGLPPPSTTAPARATAAPRALVSTEADNAQRHIYNLSYTAWGGLVAAGTYVVSTEVIPRAFVIESIRCLDHASSVAVSTWNLALTTEEYTGQALDLHGPHLIPLTGCLRSGY